jgi:ChrR Cupin-like domain
MSNHQDLVTAVHVDELPRFEVASGITGRRLPATDLVRAWMYDFEPGTQWPEEDRHEAEERYFVTQGEIIDMGIKYPAGSYLVFAPGSCHRPGSETGGQMLGISDNRNGRVDGPRGVER